MTPLTIGQFYEGDVFEKKEVVVSAPLGATAIEVCSIQSPKACAECEYSECPASLV